MSAHEGDEGKLQRKLSCHPCNYVRPAFSSGSVDEAGGGG